MMINGEEVRFPFDINNMFSQIMNEPPTQKLERTAPHQHQIIKRILICQDVNARKAILGMDKRVTKLEEQLKELLQSKNKPIIKIPTMITKKPIMITKKKIDVKKKEVKPKIIPIKNPIKKVVKNPIKNPIKKVIKKKSVSVPKKKSVSNIKKKSKR